MIEKYSWDEAPIDVKHRRMKRLIQKRLECEFCGKVGKRLHLANRNHKYSRNPYDWKYLCSKCHKIYDGEYNPPQFYEKFNALFSK